MSFLDEITNLGDNLLHAAQNRKKGVGTVIGSTQNFLGKTRREQRENARKQHQFLGKFADSLSEMTDGFSQKTHDLMSGFHRRHREMAKKQAHFLKDFAEKNGNDIGSFLGKCNKERMKFRGALDQAHKNFIRALREIEKLHGKGFSRHAFQGENGKKTHTMRKQGKKKQTGRKKRAKRRTS